MYRVSHRHGFNPPQAEAEPTPLRYFRLNIDAIEEGANAQIPEMQVMVGAVAYPQSIGLMTSNTAPVPLVASASSVFDTFQPYMAFDGVDTLPSGQHWVSAAVPAWIQIDLGAANLIVPTEFQWKTLTGGPGNNRGLVDWQLLGSTTGNFTSQPGEDFTLLSFTNYPNTNTDIWLSETIPPYG